MIDKEFYSLKICPNCKYNTIENAKLYTLEGKGECWTCGEEMIETIKRRVCDVCKKEVERFKGSLVLDYSDSDYTGCGYPVKIERKDICINCCRELEKVITEALEELAE